MERKGLPAAAGPFKSRRYTTKTHDSSSAEPPRKKKGGRSRLRSFRIRVGGSTDTEKRSGNNLTWINAAALQHR